MSEEHDWANGLESYCEQPLICLLKRCCEFKAPCCIQESFTQTPPPQPFVPHRAVLRRLSILGTSYYCIHNSSHPHNTIGHYPVLTSRKPRDTSPYSQCTPTSAPEFKAALIVLTNLSALAAQHQHFAMLKLAAVLHVVGKAPDNPERLLFLKMTVMRQAFQFEGK
ncbi:hypothetical protein J3A83DRAFT_3045971 [Scleroderma citrinum]